MKLSVGLDVSLEKTAICVVFEHGKIGREAHKVLVQLRLEVLL
jgi:hypothetical protein